MIDGMELYDQDPKQNYRKRDPFNTDDVATVKDITPKQSPKKESDVDHVHLKLELLEKNTLIEKLKKGDA